MIIILVIKIQRDFSQSRCKITIPNCQMIAVRKENDYFLYNEAT
jgi:hypothetical protein